MASQPPTPKKPAPVLAHRRSQTNWPALLIGGALLAGAGWFVWQNTRRPPEVVVIKETPKAVEAPKPVEPEKPPVAVVDNKPVTPVAPPKMTELPKPEPEAKPVVVESKPYVFGGAALNDPKLPREVKNSHMRDLGSQCQKVFLDSAGRITVPADLCKEIGIGADEPNMVFVGAITGFEIWRPDTFKDWKRRRALPKAKGKAHLDVKKFLGV